MFVVYVVLRDTSDALSCMVVYVNKVRCYSCR